MIFENKEDWPMDNKNTNFFQGVYDIVARIPAGKVISYGKIAALLGNPRAARTVGWAMSTCPDGLPWQRVVKADGTVTDEQWGDLHRSLLEAEGVGFLPNGRVDMEKHAWHPEAGEL